MKQISQNYKSGQVKLEDVAAPPLRPGKLLIAAEFSAVSIGTEGMKVREAKMSYVGMARARPDQVKKVLHTLKQQGIRATYEKVMNRLDSLTPLGYSMCGVVVEVGEGVIGYEVGQRVACAGGNANHSELVCVPKNLCVPIPSDVDPRHAAFTTVGAIAMQGYRQSEMQLGETACIIGLGLLGQILTQILAAAGISVIGVDLQKGRCQLAESSGATAAFQPDDANMMKSIHRLTGGRGVDCVFITASGSSNAPVTLAASVSRDRARVVDIGKTKLDLPWNDYYEKELDVRFSRSYGPGRYDSTYEEDGIDYPIGYVRWTERRNMQSFVELLRKKAVDLTPLITEVVPFDQAEALYQAVATASDNILGIVFDYKLKDHKALDKRAREWRVNAAKAPGARDENTADIGVIGAGNYASSMLLPHLRDDKRANLRIVATTSGLTSKNAAVKFGIEKATTDYRVVIDSADVSTILIATRHSSHSSMVCEGLRAGKNVYVEKPLAISWRGLHEVVNTISESGNNRLMVGFNRRFSPMVKRIKNTMASAGPLSILYRVHAGQIDSGSWYQDSSHGSRFVGEAGHFIDVMSFLVGARPIEVFARTLRPSRAVKDDGDNVVVTVSYEDGSVGSLLYLTQGGHKTPKERIEAFGGGRTCILNNFESLQIYDGDGTSQSKSRSIDKGQKEQMKQFVAAVVDGEDMPISLSTILDTTAVTLAAEQSVISGAKVVLQDCDVTEAAGVIPSSVA